MRILIAGAGIAGLSMALCLEKIGISFQLIEKTKCLSKGGAGIALPLNAVHALTYLGLYTQLMQSAYAVTNITYALPNGEILSTKPLTEHPLNQYPFVALHRKKLLTLLANNIKTQIEFNKYITDVRFDKKGTAITFNDNETKHFDLIICAEGINSQLRSLIEHSSSHEDLGISTWRFIANFSQPNPIYYFGKKSAFMIYPISKSEVYCYAHVSDPAYKKFIKKEHLYLAFSEYSSKINWIIRSVTQDKIIFGRLTSISKPLLNYRNIAFIGDSAHACSPMLQQGAALAIEDAITLANLISKTKNIEKILNYYENIRRPRITWIRENSDLPIKAIAYNLSDEEYNIRNLLIKKNGPINVQKWKILFNTNYLNELDSKIENFEKQCYIHSKL